jgi:hypothetical protein
MKQTSLPADATELKREHLQQLLNSQTFQRSPKLSQLLRRLVEQTLTEAPYPLKEQLLGIEVFDRPTDWDPQTDSIRPRERQSAPANLDILLRRRKPNDGRSVRDPERFLRPTSDAVRSPAVW